MPPLKVLIVEDNPDDADLLLRQLRRAGFDPEWSRVETEADFVAALQDLPEIILSDYSMPHFSGLRALELLQASGRDIPFILISGTVGEDVAVQAMRDGATDYLLKDRPVRLPSAVRRALAETRLRAERHQAEAVQARLAAIVTSSDDAIIGKTLEGIITSWNAGAERVFGYTLGEAVGQPMLMLFPPDRVEEEPDMLARVARGESVRHFETVRVRKDGTRIDVSVTLSPLIDCDGQIVGVSKIARDITERKRADEALRLSEERTRFALQNADVGIWDMDYATGVLRWSETIEAHYGLEPGGFGGTFEAFIGHVHPDDRESVRKTVETAMKSGADYSIQNRSIWPDGTIRWLSGNGRVLLGKDGEPVRGIGISLDVTERRTLEEQYQQAQKMETIGTLAGGIAHDFNNILGAMIGCTELAAMDAGGNQAILKNLAQVTAAGRRATDLVQQILAFSGQQEHARQPTHLDSVISEVFALLRATLPASVELRSHFDPATPPVLVDPTQVHQIVMNMAINASQAMKDRPGVIEVTLDAVNGEAELVGNGKGRYARLAVRDTGDGMSPTTQARIFEPFFTTKAPGEGTGLGLASVHGIMKSYGGEISVSSRLGQGSMFRLYFPAIDGAMAVEAVSDVPLPRGNGQHILFVDDEASLVAWGTSVLDRLGYRVTGQVSVLDALAAVSERAHAFDLVVTDMTMPAMTGIQFARRVREIRLDLPVILTTGYVAAGPTAVHQFGMDALLQKPITVKALAEAVHRALREEE